MKKETWTFPVLGSLILIGIISFVLYSRGNEKQDIEENKMFAVGLVIRNYYIKSRGNYIEYGFSHEGNLYRHISLLVIKFKNDNVILWNIQEKIQNIAG
ncbi:hypothetical protein [Algoriphagus terrigena]|uniref:hypothetical protein n=1 Tax=Algoriphagus terrigena TaxID=344884 RepID=UPI0003FC7094|nr:hypothetical protein [Algoriphagus terrigena]